MFYSFLVVLLFVLSPACFISGGTVGADHLRQDVSSDSLSEADSMLVFSKTAGFRHGSIPEGITCFRELGTELGLKVIATEDASIFTSKSLASVRIVVFLNTTGDILNDREQAAFESYIRSGGAWFGVHAAADTEYEWAFYKGLVGAYFKSHPAIQPARITVEIKDHPSTRMLPGLWNRTDEWYTYTLSPRDDVTVLASLDEDSFSGGGMNGDHPIAWCHEYEGGRALYTGGGHTKESYREPKFRAHLKGSLEWLITADASPTAESTADPESRVSVDPAEEAPSRPQ